MTEHNQQTSSDGHRKLKKKVSFAAGHMPAHQPALPAPAESDQDPLLTPFGAQPSMATGGGSGGLKSAFRKLSLRKPSSTTPQPDHDFDAGAYAPLDLNYPPEEALAPAPPSATSSVSSEQSWQHHDSYFPDYEPLFPTSTSGTGGSSSDYAYTDPFLEAMTPLEIQQEHHNAVLGQSIAIHYPDLPSWSEYAAAGGAKGGGSGGGAGEKAGWYTGKWGTVDEWTGYGWDGEKLPTASGAIFGVPMKEGIEIVLDDKKKQGGGEGGGGGGEGGEGGKKKKKK